MNHHLTNRLIVATAAAVAITACGADTASPDTTVGTGVADAVHVTIPEVVDTPTIDPEVRRFEQLRPEGVDPEVRRFEQLRPEGVDPEVRRFEQLRPESTGSITRYHDSVAPRLEDGALDVAVVVPSHRPASGWF